jgi:hypothetical protein
MSLIDQLDSHVEAIHKVGRKLLSAADGLPARSVEVTIRAELGDLTGRGGERHRMAADSPGPGSECYTERYICGKGPNGYIWCTRDVCIEVEPARTLPG